MTNVVKIALYGVAVFIAISSKYCDTSSAYELRTHYSINKYIAENKASSPLNDLLHTRLNLTSDLFSRDDNFYQTATEWLAHGGEWEDNWFFSGGFLPRYARHFHDPNKPINKSGLWGSFMPAVVWSQRPIGGQPGDEDYSWFDVRRYFYQALIGTDESYRSSNFADTFRGLGQLMHLIQDMSVPEHVRDDFHNPSGYEVWAKKNIDSSNRVAAYISGTSHQFNGTTLTSSPFPEIAPAPIARLFDTDTYNQEDDPNNPGDTTDPQVTESNPNIGLAEYTNVNFMSTDTYLNKADPTTQKYRYPNIQSIGSVREILIPDPINGGTIARKYFEKGTHGDTGYLLSATDYLYVYKKDLVNDEDFDKLPVLDDNVYASYAQKLIPRAVSYSAALLQYFFRGKIAVTIPEGGITAQSFASTGFDSVTLEAKNISEFNDGLTSGTLELVARYQPADEDQHPPSYVEFRYLRAQPLLNGDTPAIVDIPREPTLKSFTFDLSSDPIPFSAKNISFFLVYKGDVGMEEDTGVAVGLTGSVSPNALEISLPDAGYYAHLSNYPTPVNEAASGFTEIKIKARSQGQTLPGGQLKLVVKYIKAEGNPFSNSYFDPALGYRSTYEAYTFQNSEATLNVTGLPSAAGTPVELTFSLAQPVPLRATDVYLYLYFTDANGNVSIGFKDISEPTPVDLLNTGDAVCVNGQFYPAGSAEALAAAGTSYPNADLYPHNMANVAIRYYNSARGTSGPNPLYSLPISNAGEYQRLGYILAEPDYLSYLRDDYELLHPQGDSSLDVYMQPAVLSQRSAQNQIEMLTGPQNCGQDINGLSIDHCYVWQWRSYKTIVNSQFESLAKIWIINPEDATDVACQYGYFFEPQP